MRLCHYELLGIDRNAAGEEIKKAYRRQALVWHPDKNADRVEEATQRFALIQEAYEVLSDPQERSWYDGHRDAILRGHDRPGHRDSSAGMATEDLLRFFSASEYYRYDDSEKGFYAVYRQLFQKLSNEEREAYHSNPAEMSESFSLHPSFGDSKTPFADKDSYQKYGAFVRDFYADWSCFTTVKTFSWVDKWRPSDGPNRLVRRAMEKENRKARDSARKEYNDTIKSLVAFVKKRDPRFKAYQTAEKERREAATAERKARMQREKEEFQEQVAEYCEPEWARQHDSSPEAVSEEEEDECEDAEHYCVVCDKFYKNEKQLFSHESSRKHIRLAQALKEEMLAEEEYHKMNEELDQSHSTELSGRDSEQNTVIEQNIQDDDTLETSDKDDFEPKMNKKKKKKQKQKMTPNWGVDEQEEPSARVDKVTELTAALKLDQTRRRRRGAKKEIQDDTSKTADTKESESEQEEKEKDPVKKKREKRKDKKKQREEASLVHNCNVCGDNFETRNQLFAHINTTGHALAIPGDGKQRKR